MRRFITCLVLATLLYSPPVLPQELEEVIVTSQRREQSQQDVPVSVTAFSGDAIERQNIKSAVDYLAQTPNVSYTEDGQFGKRGAGISVRGVNNLVSGENAAVPSIGVYLDEFSVASVPNQFSNPQLPDMQRVEVLRGPQGTFFGRNAVGGALNLTTRNPDDEFFGKVTLGAETYDDAGEQWSITGVFNAPVSEVFKFRGVVGYEDNSGYVENACASGASLTSCPGAAQNGVTPNGAEDSGHEYLSIRLKGLWDVSDATTILGTLIYADEDQAHDENVPSGFLDLDTVDTLGVQVAQDPGTGFWPNNRNKLSHDRDEKNEMQTIIAIVNVAHTLNENQTLKWITGIIDSEFDRFFDQDLIGGVDTLTRANTYEGQSYSTELRFEHSDDNWDWVIGAMLSKDDQDQRNNVAISANPAATINGVGWLPPFFPEGLGLALNNKSFEIDGIAIFGDITFYVNDQWELIVGGRYSHDEVNTDLQAFGADFGTLTNFARAPANGFESFDDIAPRFGFRYQASDDVSIYGTVSKGYKAGGSSTGNNTNAPGQPAITLEYEKETLWNAEIGLKSELADNRVRLNASAFYLRWDDMQFESFRLLTPGDLSSNFEQTINVDEATAAGIEIEFEALVSENFSVSGGIGYLNTEIKHLPTVELTGGYVVSIDGLDLPKAPDLSYNLAGEYRWDIGGNEAWVRAEYMHRDGQYSDIEGLTNRQTRGPSPNQGLTRPVGANEFPYLSPDFDVVNLRGGYQADGWDLTLYVQNLLDEEYYTGTQENFGVSGIRLRPHPRVIGGSVSFSFR